MHLVVEKALHLLFLQQNKNGGAQQVCRDPITIQSELMVYARICAQQNIQKSGTMLKTANLCAPYYITKESW